MSMISEQVKELRELAEDCKCENDEDDIVRALQVAADTIEELSAKLVAANMERSSAYYGGEWIPCSERLPEEKINPITSDYQEYCVTFSDGEIFDIRHYKFGKGHWWNYGKKMDKYVIAWQPLPEPFKG